MRSQEEIVDWMRRLIREDARQDHEYTVLLPCLDFAHARPFLLPGATVDAWVSSELTRTDEAIEADAHRCLAGAWSTIERHDRVQADRLVANCRGYVWLLGTDDDLAAFDAVGSDPFGGPKFLWLVEHRDWPAPTSIGATRMGEGQPCTPLCIIRGCGR